MPKSKKNTVTDVLTSESTGSLNKLKQVNGQVENSSPVYKKTTISQVLGDKGTQVYGTMDVEVYTEKLNKMDKYDLNVHASQVNVFPHDNRQRLIKELIGAFNTHVRQYRIPENDKKPVQNPTSPIIKKILNQGK